MYALILSSLALTLALITFYREYSNDYWKYRNDLMKEALARKIFTLKHLRRATGAPILVVYAFWFINRAAGNVQVTSYGASYNRGISVRGETSFLAALKLCGAIK